MKLGFDSMANIAKIRKDIKRRRISSYDITGRNADFLELKPGQKHELCNVAGAGIIKHIWMTLASPDEDYLRKIVLRIWWDNEENPSVEVPIGDFFGMGHGKTANFWSLPFACGPNDGKSFNCFFPMPYCKGFRVEVENDINLISVLYFYIDYEELLSLPEDLGRFHAFWRRDNPCKGKSYNTKRKIERVVKPNETHENDYLVLEAEGEGHFVGMHLNIHNLRETEKFNWPGEGDDYIEIDNGEITLYGTGTEDYFCTAWCPAQYYSSPYFGVSLTGGKNYSGKISYYRYHIEDPIYFHKNIKVKIEHGHANQRSDDWSSTAYWYQIEPHKKLDPLPITTERLPRRRPEEIL
jgi:hypothetical protein